MSVLHPIYVHVYVLPEAILDTLYMYDRGVPKSRVSTLSGLDVAISDGVMSSSEVSARALLLMWPYIHTCNKICLLTCHYLSCLW